LISTVVVSGSLTTSPDIWSYPSHLSIVAGCRGLPATDHASRPAAPIGSRLARPPLAGSA